jgi:hypothetical protein
VPAQIVFVPSGQLDELGPGGHLEEAS